MIATGYSFRHAVGSLPEVISRLKEIGWETAPIADRTSTFAHVKWSKLAKEAGLRPVHGVSLGCSPSLDASRPAIDFWKFLAVNSLTDLHDALYEATSRAAHEPWLSYARALELPGLIKISGSRLLVERVSPRDDFYVAMSPATPKGLFRLAREMGHRFVATSDNCYPRHDDERMYLAAMGRRSQSQTYPRHILSDADLRIACWYADDASFADALANRERILSSCRAELRRARMISPAREKTLLQMCRDGAEAKGVDLSDPVYAARLERELRVIEEKRFEDYFHVVADLMQWSRRHMLCGPGRGSAAGSLVCWLTDITSVDPIKYDLVFERFIDVTRMDYPDIDVDLSDERRDLVFSYLKGKYGREKVARLATVTMFQSKSALNQIGAAIGVPRWMIENAVNSVITRSSGDSRADYRVSDTLSITAAGQKLVREYPEMVLAGRIESHPVNSGQHSAGVVMTDGSIREVVGVSAHNDVAMVDWKDAKAIDLLKIDILGLSQLSIFESAMRMIGLEPSSSFLERLPLDDPAAFEVVNKKHLAGLFQFQGGATRLVVQQLGRMTEFEDVVSITALCRPGPLGSGSTQSWINRKNGVEKVEVFHEAFFPYLEKTMGVMIYQEQIMRICREIGDMSWEAITTLRGAMGKSLGMEFFDNYRDQFMPGALSRGIPEDVARMMWDKMCTFGMYGFNRAHAVSYSLLTYWCMWFKAHHPMEFAAATLDAEADPAKQIDLLRELREEGIDYVAVDRDESSDRWAVSTREGRKILLGPLTMIRGVGPAAAEKIIAARTSGEPLPPSLEEKLAAPRTDVDTLYPVEAALRRNWPGLLQRRAVSEPIEIALRHVTPIGRLIETRAGRGAVIVGVLVRNRPLNENEPNRVARRGWAIPPHEPVNALNFHVRDDSGEMLCKISRWEYPRIGEILTSGKPGRSIFAIGGRVPQDFRMVWVKHVKYLGELDGEERDLGPKDVSEGDGGADRPHVRESHGAAQDQGGRVQ